jgi:hypothetical protein
VIELENKKRMMRSFRLLWVLVVLVWYIAGCCFSFVVGLLKFFRTSIGSLSHVVDCDTSRDSEYPCQLQGVCHSLRAW